MDYIISPPLIYIVIVATALLLPGIILLTRLKPEHHPQLLVTAFVLGICLTLGSLMITDVGYSGTGIRVYHGWPHFYYYEWTSFESTQRQSGIIWGPLGTYILCNIAFYSAVSLIVLIAAKYLRASRQDTDDAETP